MLKLLQKEENYISVSRYETAKGKRYCVKCGNHTKRGFKTKKEAKEYEKYLKAKLLNDKFEREENGEPEKPTLYFKEVAEDYLNVAYNESDITYGTWQKKKEILNYAILINIPNKPMEKFTERDCVAFRKKIKETKYSTTHKNDTLREFKAIFKHGRRYFGLKNDPTYVIDPFKKTFDDRMKIRERDARIWTDEQFAEFISCVDDERYRVFFIVLFYTGIRLGEAQALKWSDLDGTILHIYKSLSKTGGNYYLCETNPKTASSIRDIDIGPELALYLDEYKKKLKQEHNDFDDEWYLLGGQRYISRTSAARYKDIAIEKAGVPRMTLHDFRHAHASNLIAKGVNVVSVSRRLGHSSVNITLDVYTHLIDRDETEIVNNLNFKNVKNRVKF